MELLVKDILIKTNEKGLHSLRAKKELRRHEVRER